MTFDKTLPALTKVLESLGDRLALLGTVIVNRDLNGRVRLIIDRDIEANEDVRQVIEVLTKEIAEKLIPHTFPAGDVVLFEPNVETFLSGISSYPLDGVNNVRVIDRLATEGDWATIAPKTTKAPRMVFFSIKGGVGRSTALAVASWSLAQKGKKVLVFDVDLESPGLSSSLLPAERRPTYGITDWLVEDLVDNGDEVVNDMVATSALSHDGEIFIVPAHGREPGEYVAKLGRVWMPKAKHGQIRESWSARLARLIEQLEDRYRPDIVLIDSRAGIDEVASACVTDLGATMVLAFAIDGEQTWTGYRSLFRHWRKAGGASEIRARLQLVGAMVPELNGAAYVESLQEHAWNLFTEELYDEVPPGVMSDGLWSFDKLDESAPHYPWTIRWRPGFAALLSLHSRMESLDPVEVMAVFGPLNDGIASMLDEPT